MSQRYMLIVGLLFTGAGASVAALAYAQAPGKPRPLILARDEGDLVGNHYIKADPQSGSMRLGVGLQRLKGGQGTGIHMHEQEDELLFIHSGSGLGVVGDQRRNISAGTTLYIPQGTWHGVESDGDELEILWVVSPPHFAETLREGAADASDAGKGSAAVLDEIGRTHGYRDSRHWFLPGFARIAATLALGAVFIPLLSRVRPFRAAAFYALGATIATIVTLLALAMGSLSSIVIALSALLIAVGIFMATLGGIGFRALASRLASRSS
jgi:mannose-6-phosphate isomerase-like protein (cupin superfamily)